jgi:hypothetical protein
MAGGFTGVKVLVSRRGPRSPLATKVVVFCMGPRSLPIEPSTERICKLNTNNFIVVRSSS